MAENDNQSESLGFLAEWSNVSYNTLLKAAEAQPQRLKARKSGKVWLSTKAAVREYKEGVVLKPRQK